MAKAFVYGAAVLGGEAAEQLMQCPSSTARVLLRHAATDWQLHKARQARGAPLLQCSCLTACNRDAPAGCRQQQVAGRSSCTGSRSDCTNECDQRWSSLPAEGPTHLSTDTQEQGARPLLSVWKALPGCCETLLLHSPGRAGRDLQHERPGSVVLLCWGIVSTVDVTPVLITFRRSQRRIWQHFSPANALSKSNWL